MKIAEALIRRSDLQKRIEQMKNRLKQNVITKEGCDVLEEPADLFKELSGMLKQYEDLIRRINKTNLITTFPDGISISEKFAHRENLTWYVSILREALESASGNSYRYSSSETPLKVMIDVKELRKRIDQISKDIRELDIEIQKKNWEVDLCE